MTDSFLQNMHRSQSGMNTIENHFHEKMDYANNNFNENSQEKGFQGALGTSIDGQIQNNHFISSEMNKLNFALALDQVVKKAGENAKGLTN